MGDTKWSRDKFAVGKYLIGKNYRLFQTGRDNLVRVLYAPSENSAPFVLAKNGHVYSLKESRSDMFVEFDGSPSSDKIMHQHKMYSRLLPYGVLQFGDVISTVGSLVTVFIGVVDFDNASSSIALFEDFSESRPVAIVQINESAGGTQHNPMMISEKECAKYESFALKKLGMKRMTVHYININGERTKTEVDEESEIKDMKEKLYTMTN